MTKSSTPPFAFAVIVLLVAGLVTRFSDFNLVKAELPLQQPLNLLSETALGPYEVVKRDVMEAAMVEALGTERYIKWVLKDTSLPEDAPLRMSSLFVTYYSGGSTLVPHTPDVCYLVGGYSKAQPHENKELTIDTLDGDPEVPIRVCTFQTTAVRGEKITVLYTFFCNGKFVCTRDYVRLLTHNPSDKYAFFSKVEISFPGASREESLAAAPRLLRYLLPELRRSHWPDFAAAEAAARADDSSS
ncbi:MAG: hypothetical protein ACPGXK_03170 [Phycisphaerae bacterium]